MKKYIVYFLFALILAACSKTTIDLPPGADKSKAACPEVTDHQGSICYSVPSTHNETMKWYERNSSKEGWTFHALTDDEPFTFYLISTKHEATITLYRQENDDNTGLLIKFVKR